MIWLHPSSDGYQSPRTLGATTGMTVVAVDDADAHHACSSAAGADIVEAPVDQGYGVRSRAPRPRGPPVVLPLPAGLNTPMPKRMWSRRPPRLESKSKPWLGGRSPGMVKSAHPADLHEGLHALPPRQSCTSPAGRGGEGRRAFGLRQVTDATRASCGSAKQTRSDPPASGCHAQTHERKRAAQGYVNSTTRRPARACVRVRVEEVGHANPIAESNSDDVKALSPASSGYPGDEVVGTALFRVGRRDDHARIGDWRRFTVAGPVAILDLSRPQWSECCDDRAGGNRSYPILFFR